MKKILIIILSFTMVGCTSPESAKKTLNQAGYSDIKITGYNFMACSKDDTFHTGFRAKGPTSIEVSGTVCAGFMKGSTIRLD